jgi:hypothetical protein
MLLYNRNGKELSGWMDRQMDRQIDETNTRYPYQRGPKRCVEEHKKIKQKKHSHCVGSFNQ